MLKSDIDWHIDNCPLCCYCTHTHTHTHCISTCQHCFPLEHSFWHVARCLKHTFFVEIEFLHFLKLRKTWASWRCAEKLIFNLLIPFFMHKRTKVLTATRSHQKGRPDCCHSTIRCTKTKTGYGNVSSWSIVSSARGRCPICLAENGFLWFENAFSLVLSTLGLYEALPPIPVLINVTPQKTVLVSQF